MNNIIIFLTAFVLFSCKQKEELSIKKNPAEETIISYDIKWVERQISSESKELLQLYISNDEDTLINQRKVFKEKVLDTLESDFYHLEFNRLNTRNKGKLSIPSSLQKKFKNSKESNIWLYLIRFEKDNIDIVEFHSINSTNVDFDFVSEKDILIGMVKEQVEIDTVVNDEKMIRLVESMFVIDNRNKTDNPFISAFIESQ